MVARLTFNLAPLVWSLWTHEAVAYVSLRIQLFCELVDRVKLELSVEEKSVVRLEEKYDADTGPRSFCTMTPLAEACAWENYKENGR